MIAAILVFSQTAQTANISDVTAESDQWLVAQVDSQKRVDGLAEEGRDTAEQYRSSLRESEGLKLYLQQLRAQLKSQEEEMAVIRQESQELDRTNIEILPLYTLELDKSVQEVESPASGTLKVHAATGEVYPVGTLIAEIL